MKPHFWQAAIILALFCSGCATVTVTNQNAVVKSEFIFTNAPFPSCHASTIAETKSGLVAAWFGGTAERNPDVCIYVSRDENGKWTPPVAVADGTGFATNRFPTWNPVLFQPKNGPLLLFYKVGPKPAEWWGMMMTSADDGKTWSKPPRLPDGILGPIKNKPVQLANGDILCGSSTEGDGWKVHFERTSDFGKTWTATPPVNDGKNHRRDSAEHFVFERWLAGSRLAARAMTKFSKSHRADDGKTWGEMSLTDLPNPDSGTDAVTLRDGRQLLVYNHNIRTGSNNKGRSPLNVAISDDGTKLVRRAGFGRRSQRAEWFCLSRRHSNERRPGSHHLHLGTQAHQARRD